MTAATTSGQFPTWEYDLLKALGAPINDPQLYALNYWARAEGMPSTTNNFLAITDPGQEFGATGGDPAGALATGVWNYSSDGQPLVVTFASLSSGINALVSFLQHGHTGVVDALRDPNATVQSIAQAVQDDGAWGNDGASIAKQDGTTVIFRGGSATGPNGDKAGLGPSTFYQCNSSNTIIGEGGIVFGIGKANLLNPCQAKALVGGFTVFLGAFIFVGGLALVATAGVEKLGLGSAKTALFNQLSKTQDKVLGPTNPGTKTLTAEQKSNAERQAARKQWEAKYGRPWSQSPAGMAEAKKTKQGA